jgi:hypothetical protein
MANGGDSRQPNSPQAMLGEQIKGHQPEDEFTTGAKETL